MRGVVGVASVKTRFGTFVIRIECRDEESYRRVVRKLRLIGIFVDKVKEDG